MTASYHIAADTIRAGKAYQSTTEPWGGRTAAPGDERAAMVVDHSLARGVSLFALRQLALETEAALDARPDYPDGGKERAKRTRFLDLSQKNLDRLALRITHTARIGYGGALSFLILTGRDEQNATIGHSVAIGIRGDALIREYRGPAIRIEQHALKRLNQRSAMMHLEDVRAILRPCATLLVLLSFTMMEMETKPQQVSIPFHDGVIRCDVNDCGDRIVVKTFVPQPSTRETALIDDLSARIGDIDESALSSIMWAPWAIEAIRERKPHPLAIGAMAALTHGRSRIREALYAHDWIFEPYVERPDPVGDLWRAANEARLETEDARPG
jgi:hypothetical protein